MKIKKIQFRNFSSYGNITQELVFKDHESLFTFIEGKNGAGKSSTSDVIKFAIYGKLNTKNLKDIPNRINQNCWTNVEIVSNNKNITIERGINPTYLKLWIDGVEYDQANKKQVQKFIDDELIDLPFMVFDNTLSISIRDFKSFLKMSPGEKRAIIDRIFSLNVFNEMRNILKNELKEINDLTNNYRKEIHGLNKSIDSTETEITSLENRLQIFSASESVRLAEELSKYKDLMTFIIQKYNSAKDIEKTLLQNNLKITRNKDIIQSEIRTIDDKLKLYDNNKCPHCESDLKTEFHLHIKDQFIDEKNKKVLLLNQYKSEELSIQDEITKSKSDLLEAQEKHSKCKFKILQLEEKINDNKDVKTEEVYSLNKLKTGFEEQMLKINEEVNLKEKENKFLNLVDTIIGDDGVKKVIVKSIIPGFNREINRMLSKIHVNYLINFNEDLEPIITEYGHPISPETLSAGESAKTDFVVLVALIKMMKIKFNNINVLFLDEIFANLDSEAVHEVINILKNISSDLKLNIFVIHHAPLQMEYFDQKMIVTKKDSFSNFTIEKI